ncbi:MAG: AAA family ATPase [Candidatus Hydrothermarchaeales archaeon]
MSGLYVIGTSGSGKTATCLGLAQKFQEAGLRVSYFKPIGNVGDARITEDEDAKLMKHVLKMKAPLEKITLFTLGFDYLEKYDKNKSKEYLNVIADAYQEVSEGSDVVIIEGTTNPQAMLTLNLATADIASKLGVKMLMVSTIKNDFRMDNLLLHNEYLRSRGVNLIGTIINFVPPKTIEKTETLYAPILEKRGFRILGVVPESIELTSPTVQEIHDILGGEILTGEDSMQLLLKSFLIGAMTAESALNYFKTTPEKAVITGGDRSEIALAALETSTSALILTGDLHPDPRVLSKAKEKGVPTILVPYDTYTTVEKLHDISRKIKPDDERSKRLTKELVNDYCDWEEIIKELEKQ